MVFRPAATVIDAWLAFVRGFRRLWRALPGDLLGLFVMRACAIPVPGRTADVGEVSAVLIEHPNAARYLDHQLMPVHAQTLGRYILAREPMSSEMVAHELEHVRQWERLGPFFLPAYAASSALAMLRRRHPYRANRYEAAARRRAIASSAATPDRRCQLRDPH